MWARRSRVRSAAPKAGVRVVMPRAAMVTVFDECDAFPDDETGGRIVGTYAEEDGALTIRVSGIIEPGPGARRSRVSLFQDGEHQERVFRQIERDNPDIEHLGSWHTHHVNGLPHLSGGDIATYTRTVNHRNHNTSFFYALLVTARNAGGRGMERYDFKHYVFRRGVEEFVEVPVRDVELTDEPLLWPAAAAGQAAAPDGPARPAAAIAPVAPPPVATAVERPGRVSDRDAIAALYGGFRSFTSPQLGFYWRGKVDLVDGSSQEVIVVEGEKRGAPAYSAMVRNAPAAIARASEELAEEEFKSAAIALAMVERSLNKALYDASARAVR